MPGVPLALGGVAALVLGTQLCRFGRRGSRALSPLQQRLLRVKNQYKAKPEVVVRTYDVVLSMLPGQAHQLVGVKYPIEYFERDIRSYLDNSRFWKKEQGVLVERMNARLEREGRQADIREYMELVTDMIRHGNYFINVDLSLNWVGTPYIPWVAREVGRAVKAAKGDHGEIGSKLDKLVRQGPRIFDWAQATSPDMMKLKLTTAKARSDRWHRELEGTVSRVGKKRNDTLPAKVLYDWRDGWTAVELTNKQQFVEEGKILHHCIGSVSSYYENTAAGKTRTISLRKDGEPWLTITVSKGDTPRQRYNHGFFDRFPGDSSSRKPKWFPKEVLEAECVKLRDMFDMEGIGWTPTALCRDRLHAHDEREGKKAKLLERSQGAKNRRGPRRGSLRRGR